MRFSRQKYWSGLPFPPPGDLPSPGIKLAFPVSPALQADSLPTELSGKPKLPLKKLSVKNLIISYKQNHMWGTSLMVQCLRLHALGAGSTYSIPGWGTKILQAIQLDQKTKNKLPKHTWNIGNILRIVHCISALLTPPWSYSTPYLPLAINHYAQFLV